MPDPRSLKEQRPTCFLGRVPIVLASWAGLSSFLTHGSLHPCSVMVPEGPYAKTGVHSSAV